MKIRISLLKSLIISSFMIVGGSFSVDYNRIPVKQEANQYLADFAPYTYSGNYYNAIDFSKSEGMNGDLRKAITSLIVPQGFYTYSGSGDSRYISTQLQYADEDPTNSSNMIYLYTRDSVAKNAAVTWNREHVWPQSLSNGNWGENKGGVDILHLRPTYNSVNSSRGNKPYGDVQKQGPVYYETMLYGYTAGGTYFEPIDQVKGDVARTIMYLWTAYNGYPNYASLDIEDVFQSYDTLLKRHTQDKPDMLEGNRNNYCQTSLQKNRNPFVDCPELAWKIFGSQASTEIKNACMEAYPFDSSSGGDPIEEPEVDDVVEFVAGTDKGSQTGGANDSLSKGGVTLSTELSPLGNDDNYRIYKNKTLTISVAAGSTKTIKKVSFVCTAQNAAQYGPGCFGTQEGYTYNGYNGTWTGDASRVSFTASTNQVRATKIVVSTVSDEQILPTGIVLDKSSLNLVVGDVSTLSATLSPAGVEANITWSSEDENVATVNQSGKVTAVGEGSTSIKAKVSDSLYATCTVTVQAQGEQDTNYNSVGSLSYNKDTSVVIDNKLSDKNDPHISYTSTSGVNVDVRKNTSSNDVNVWQNTYPSCRWYVGHKITISSASEFNRVELTCDSGYRTFKDEAEGNTIATLKEQGVTVEYDGAKIILTFDSPVKSFNLIPDSQIRPSLVELLYKSPSIKERIEQTKTSASLSYNYEQAEGVVTDTLTKSFTGVSGTSYSNWENKTDVSGVVYAGNSAGGNSSVQLRASDNAGIITTQNSNNALIAKVEIRFNSETANGRTIEVYGKNSAYTSTSDLYDSNKAGTLIGSFAYDGSKKSGTIEIDGSYEYIGLKSQSGALYAESIKIYWTTHNGFSFSDVAIRFGGFISKELWDAYDTNEHNIKGYGVLFSSVEYLNSNALKDYYDSIDGTNVKKFDTDLEEKNKEHPAEANDTQKGELEGTYYVWNLYKKISDAKLNYDYVSVAYIRTESEVIFLKQTIASAKSLAAQMIENGVDENSYDGSLKYLSNIII